MELPTDTDDEVVSWIAGRNAADLLRLRQHAGPIARRHGRHDQRGLHAVRRASVDLRRRNRFHPRPAFDHVKVVGAVNHAAIFPACRAVVHHGGAGTTAAGMRAGIPTLILWVTADQPIWAAQVKRLKVGSARRFSSTTQESLVAELRRILAPQYVTRAREVATQMTKPAESVTTAADLLEDCASGRAVSLMWGLVLLFALSAAQDPVRIGVMALLIARPRPMHNLLAYWLGLMATGFGAALAALFVLHDFLLPVVRVVTSVATNPVVPPAQIALGVLALSTAAMLAMRCSLRQAPHAAMAGAAMPGGDPSLRCSSRKHRPYSRDCRRRGAACLKAWLKVGRCGRLLSPACVRRRRSSSAGQQ